MLALLLIGLMLQLVALPSFIRFLQGRPSPLRRFVPSGPLLITGSGLCAAFALHDADYSLLGGQVMLAALGVFAVRAGL